MDTNRQTNKQTDKPNLYIGCEDDILKKSARKNYRNNRSINGNEKIKSTVYGVHLKFLLKKMFLNSKLVYCSYEINKRK